MNNVYRCLVFLWWFLAGVFQLILLVFIFSRRCFRLQSYPEFSRRNIWSFGVLLSDVLVLIVLCTGYLGLIVTIRQHDPIVRSLVTFAMS